MRRTHRHLGLVLTTFLLGACAAAPSASVEPSGATPSGQPSAQPTAKATPAPTLGATLPPSTPSLLPTGTPLPPPAVGCIAIDDANLADLEVSLGSVDADGNGGDIGISVGRVGAILDVTRITELSGQGRSIIPQADQKPRERGLLLGGHEFIAFPSAWFDGHVNPQAMIAATVTLTLDGQAPIDLPTRFVPGNVNFDQFAVTVPDAAGQGTLAMDLVWADPCFRYEASTAIPVDVVPLSVTAGCALEQNAYYDQVAALLSGSLRVGSTTARAFSPRNEAKFAPWINPGIDAFVVYAFDRDDPAIIAAPGTALTIAQVAPGITLGKDMTLDVWTRASVARAVKDYPPHGLTLVLSRTPVKQADGTFRLRVPQAPGRYVAGVTLSYDSQCSSGALWFIVNIDVVAPTPTAAPAT
jgi:hypothetical protein